MQPPALSLAPTQAGAPRNDNKNIFLPRAWHSPAESFEKVYFPAGEGAVLTKPGKVAPVADSQGLSGNWMSPSPTPPYTPHTPAHPAPEGLLPTGKTGFAANPQFPSWVSGIGVSSPAQSFQSWVSPPPGSSPTPLPAGDACRGYTILSKDSTPGSSPQSSEAPATGMVETQKKATVPTCSGWKGIGASPRDPQTMEANPAPWA